MTAADKIRKMPANAFALFFVRSGVVGVVALLCCVTVWYCTSVYFDQNAALQEVLSCASKVLQEQNTTYWLDQGTLLGASRNKKFVVWDGDVTLGAVSNFTGSLFEVMEEVASNCQLHFTVPPEFEAYKQQAKETAEDFATRAKASMPRMVWYLYNAHVGLKVLEWTPTNHPHGMDRPGNHLDSHLQSAMTAASVAGSALGAAMLSHGTELYHKLDTFFPLRPCELHALEAVCPNNEAAVLESHFGGDWFNATMMSLFN